MTKALTFGFHHGGISVPDLDEALDWYERVLGFKLLRQFDIPQIPARVAEVKNGDLHMEIFEVPGAAPLPDERRLPDTDNRTHGNKHVSFIIANVEEFAEVLKERGADIVWVKRMPHGANIFIRDCAGNLIEFVEGAIPAGIPGQL